MAAEIRCACLGEVLASVRHEAVRQTKEHGRIAHTDRHTHAECTYGGVRVTRTKKGVQCAAHYQRREGTDNLRGSPGRFAIVSCGNAARASFHNVNGPGFILSLCATHARLARQGFVAAHGDVEGINTRADYGRYPEKFLDPVHRWLPGASPRRA